MQNRYSSFLDNLSSYLLDHGWKTVELLPELFSFAAIKRHTVTIVTTTYTIAIIKGDNLSKEMIRNAVDEMHTTKTKNVDAPLFPTVNILVFVFEKEDNKDWIIENGKRTDTLQSQFTVSWVITIPTKSLQKHKGLPKISCGESEIISALHSYNE